MQLGRFTIEPLSEGQFELFGDGKINRRPVSTSGEQKSPRSRDESLVGVNPLYITDGKHHLLLDTGLGWGLDAGSSNENISNIRSNLGIFGLETTEITHIVLSHLHYDHAAGLSYTDENAVTRPTFPNATCYLGQAEWKYAAGQVAHQTPASLFYQLDDLYRLYADEAFTVIENKEYEIIPGISVIKTGGHTPGHQIVKIADGRQVAYFAGDLLPTAHHLNYYDVASRHTNRMLVKEMKMKLLRQAYREKAVLFFYHALHSGAGRLAKDEEKNYVLKEIETP